MKKYPIYLILIPLLFVLSSYAVLIKERSISNFKLKSATTNKWVSVSDYKNAKRFCSRFFIE